MHVGRQEVLPRQDFRARGQDTREARWSPARQLGLGAAGARGGRRRCGVMWWKNRPRFRSRARSRSALGAPRRLPAHGNQTSHSATHPSTTARAGLARQRRERIRRSRRVSDQPVEGAPRQPRSARSARRSGPDRQHPGQSARCIGDEVDQSRALSPTRRRRRSRHLARTAPEAWTADARHGAILPARRGGDELSS
jgi:hypothetical protein